jgi:hypothetical protein
MLDSTKPPSCAYEEQILAGEFSEELVTHMETCAVCQEVKLVQGFLERASQVIENPQISSAGLIWWRARLYEKRALAERSVAPIQTVQKVALIVALALIAILAATAGPAWFGKESPLVVWVVVCGCGLIASTAGLLAIWARSPK